MATETINDWVVAVGMDTSQVERGVQRVNRIMNRLARTQARLSSQMARPIMVTLDTTAADLQIRNLRNQMQSLSGARPPGARPPIDLTRPPRPPAGNRPPAGDRPFSLPEERQQRISNTIDSVIRRASRRLGDT